MMQNAVKNNSKALLTSLFMHFLFFEKIIVMGPKGPGTGTRDQGPGTRDQGPGTRTNRNNRMVHNSSFGSWMYFSKIGFGFNMFFTSIGKGDIFSSSEGLIHEKNKCLTDFCHFVDRLLRTNVKIIVHFGIYNLCLRVSVPAGAFFSWKLKIK